MAKVCVINIVGLTPGMIGPDTPSIASVAEKHGARPMGGVVPAVTCSAQASMLTGTMPSDHGVVGNGWLFRDTREARFWQQSRSLMQGETIYDAARRKFPGFTCANLFWWFNQGAKVDWALTPKPWYGCDGDKRFGVHGKPEGFPEETEKRLGAFPFHTFWGPTAGLPCSEWIAKAAALTLREKSPSLTLVYLPHLDYDLQRFGPTREILQARLPEIDRCAKIIIDAAKEQAIEIAIVSEYGITKADRPVHINRILRDKGYLAVRSGPFGEIIDFPECRACAVADHQIAHVYVEEEHDRESVRQLLLETDGIAEVWGGREKKEHGLDHPRSGDLVAVAERDAWFTYYYWRDDARAPDFARTVDIHRKPGYDPCELFFDPALNWPKGRAALRLLQKKIGMRTRFDLVPLDASLVKGSHGAFPASPDEGPVIISSSGNPGANFAMTDFKNFILNLLAK
ncbi:MAG: alkaline phosphatase family protein [Planctomycetes bacterium]|nr:alkaline phosphatase family protein [Planctomycetota bacterium]